MRRSNRQRPGLRASESLQSPQAGLSPCFAYPPSHFCGLPRDLGLGRSAR
jgi:hypothetical protein